MLPSPSLNSSEMLHTSSASEEYSSWYFSDKGIGTSVDNDTRTEFSNTENFEKQICDLHTLRQKLIELDHKKEQILQDIKSQKTGFDQKRLEAERTILSTTLKTKLLLSEFKQKYEPKGERKFYDVGSVTVQNLKLHYAPSKKFKQYFLCALTCGASVFLSHIFEPDSEGVVNFYVSHTFLNLPVNFEICIKIYVLKVKKENFRKKIEKKFSCFYTYSSEDDENQRRESMFSFWKETIINISNVNKSNEILLVLVDSKLCKVVFDVVAKTDISIFSVSGWMDVSKNGLFWNQRWCVLKGSLLKCFSYPTDNCYNCPLNVIDLNLCSAVKISTPYEESRTRVIVLELNDDSNQPFFFYLSTYSNYDLNQWKVLEKLVPTLHFWKNSLEVLN